MDCDYRCPYCGDMIDDADYWDSEPDESYEVECNCGHTFKVSYYLDPVFTVEIPEELTCAYECDYWNGIDEYCVFGTSEQAEFNVKKMRREGKPAKPLDCCPLGYNKERDA